MRRRLVRCGLFVPCHGVRQLRHPFNIPNLRPVTWRHSHSCEGIQLCQQVDALLPIRAADHTNNPRSSSLLYSTIQLRSAARHLPAPSHPFGIQSLPPWAWHHRSRCRHPRARRAIAATDVATGLSTTNDAVSDARGLANLRPASALRTPNELYTLEVAEDPPFFTNNQRVFAQWDAEVHSVSPAGGPVSGNTTVHIHGYGLHALSTGSAAMPLRQHPDDGDGRGAWTVAAVHVAPVDPGTTGRIPAAWLAGNR